MSASAAPIPIHHLTPEDIRSVYYVRAIDPRADSTGILLGIPGRWDLPPDADRTVVVHIDMGRATADLISLRRVIDLAAGLRTGARAA